jgi:HK97 gp10 family phage protein
MAKRSKRTVRFVVTGNKELDRKIKKLGPKLSSKIARNAARAALKPIHKDVISFAPRDTGEMAAGIKLRAAKSRKRGQIVLEIRTDGPHGYLAVFNEYGTRRGNPPRPFMRRAFELHKDSSRKILIDIMWREIARALKV